MQLTKQNHIITQAGPKPDAIFHFEIEKNTL